MDNQTCCQLNSYHLEMINQQIILALRMCVVKCLFVWIWWTRWHVGVCLRMCDWYKMRPKTRRWLTLCGLSTEERNTTSVYDYMQQKFMMQHTIKSFICFFSLHVNLMCMCRSYLSILCSLLGVMPLPLSVKVRHSWLGSSTTSIQNCLADTPGSDALSATLEKEKN